MKRASQQPGRTLQTSGRAADAALVLLTKAPIPGTVKTRLCPPLTPDEASTLHGSLVLDALERLPRMTKKPRLDCFMACAPSSEHVFFQVIKQRFGITLLDQVGETLGDRMSEACRALFLRGYRAVLLTGTDLPSVHDTLYVDALHLLEESDVVIGPALDGGYYLLALKRPGPELFQGIPWSTSEVLKTTQEKAAARGWQVRLLPPQRDLDTVEDLTAAIEYTNRTHSHGGGLSKRTAGVLRLLASRHQLGPG